MKLMNKILVRLAAGVCAASALCMTVFAESGASSDGQKAVQAPSLMTTVVPLLITLVLLYFIMMRPQQKREKEAQQMRENVRIGDEVCTAGGIVGIVLKINEDSVVLETGGERNKIRVKKWAIHENITQMEEAAAKERERKAARRNGIAAAPVDSADGKSKKKKND